MTIESLLGLLFDRDGFVREVVPVPGYFAVVEHLLFGLTFDVMAHLYDHFLFVDHHLVLPVLDQVEHHFFCDLLVIFLELRALQELLFELVVVAQNVRTSVC